MNCDELKGTDSETIIQQSKERGVKEKHLKNNLLFYNSDNNLLLERKLKLCPTLIAQCTDSIDTELKEINMPMATTKR